jgi:hypothetical protein
MGRWSHLTPIAYYPHTLGGCPRIALAVIPVKTGIQKALIYLDARFRGHDDNEIRSQFSDSLLA